MNSNNNVWPVWRQWPRVVVLCAAVTVLSACGGGGGSSAPAPVPPQAAPTSGTALGVVTGFGSVIVDGVHYDDKQAKFSSESESGEDAAGTPSSVKLGQRVEVRFAQSAGSATASEIQVSPEVVGTVISIDLANSSFVVAGQTIKINTDAALGAVTVFDGLANLAALKVGDRVEVHGMAQVGAGGTAILASRIEREPGSGIAVRVTGTISNLSSDGKQFQLGNTLVVLGTNAKITPANTVLANGQRAKAFSRSALDVSNPAQPKLTADAVRVRGVSGESQALMRIAGFISQWVSASDFVVDGVKVNANTLAASLPASNQNGTFVRVQGTFDATTKVLTASSIKTGRDISPEAANELKGAITDFVSLDSFKVRNTPVSVSSTTRVTNGTTADLKNGAFVEVKGAISNGVFVATSVELKVAENGNQLEVAGSIVALDLTAGTLSIQTPNRTVSVKLGSGATCDDGCKFADLKVGVTIKVEGVLEGGVLVAREVKIQLSTPSEVSNGRADDGGLKLAEIEGIVSAVSSNSLTVNGKAILISKVTVIAGEGSLTVGRHVEVKMVQLPTGEWQALIIKLKKD